MNVSTPSPQSHHVQPLHRDDLRHLRLRRHFRFDAGEIGDILGQNPESSFWIPETDEMILVGNWRHREDIHAVQALAATTGEAALLARAREQAQRAGVRAFLLIDTNEIRRPAFYQRHGFQVIDRIATYELDERSAAMRHPVRLPAGLRYTRVGAGDHVLVDAVTALDHVAFPWFWWNVRAEFDAYLRLGGVEVWVGILDGDVVAYIGITHYGSWGHLDRIATDPHHQRAGIGRASLELAIERLRARGARRIALSTQGENGPAQQLYVRRGFTATPVHDYTVYGIVLDPSLNGNIASLTASDINGHEWEPDAPPGRDPRERNAASDGE